MAIRFHDAIRHQNAFRVGRKIMHRSGEGRSGRLTASNNRSYRESMGGHEREARLARAAYLAAVIRLTRAMRRWEDAGVELDPGRGDPAPWTPEQHQLTHEAAQAWSTLLARRRAYEASLRPRPTH
jgi:hypothetical protein